MPHDYSAGAGQFLACFHPRAIHRIDNSKSTHPIDLKFLGKRYFHAKNINLKFGCKRPSMLKVIVPYSITTEPKLACCQPRAQTIILMVRNRVWLLDATNINSQSSWCTGFEFSKFI